MNAEPVDFGRFTIGEDRFVASGVPGTSQVRVTVDAPPSYVRSPVVVLHEWEPGRVSAAWHGGHWLRRERWKASVRDEALRLRDAWREVRADVA
ncbi:hypothetical protein LX16_3315 [Stackebrandtia albiflava]|uniref:Uncharacterized protein n=1 Tax=Stackebrandtia albiflava TaxID=406432 RepID=A0A562V3X6_9ACTN|nr:hypothetical protein [Stackebrandtia albiflava]TWJ12555.1 hypothetical protein LX16_3315 [Stackebrandtia albiflava]